MDNEYKRAANITVIIAGLVVAAWLFFKYALSALLPFILAAIISAAISSPAKKISERTRLPLKAVSVILVAILFLAILSAIYFAVSKLVSEAENLAEMLSADPDLIARTIGSIHNIFSPLEKHFGFLQKVSDSDMLADLGINIGKIFSDAFGSLIASITNGLPSAAVGIAVKIPEALIFVAVLLISVFYFSADRHTIIAPWLELLPDKWRKNLPKIKEGVGGAIKGYAKAYLLIMAMTFCEVLLGLTVLKVNYAFLLSLIIATVDILPILGAGTVLIPWALVALATHQRPLGFGLLILYGVVTVIRQIAEPRIVGSSLGLHPVAALASVYVGLKIFGFGGIFLGPISALILKGLVFPQNSPPLQSVTRRSP